MYTYDHQKITSWHIFVNCELTFKNALHYINSEGFAKGEGWIT